MSIDVSVRNNSNYLSVFRYLDLHQFQISKRENCACSGTITPPGIGKTHHMKKMRTTESFMPATILEVISPGNVEFDSGKQILAHLSET